MKNAFTSLTTALTLVITSFLLIPSPANAITEAYCDNWAPAGFPFNSNYVYNYCVLSIYSEPPIPGWNIDTMYLSGAWYGDVYYYPSGTPYYIGANASDSEQTVYPGPLDGNGFVSIQLEADIYSLVRWNSLDLEWNPYCYLGTWSFKIQGVIYTAQTEPSSGSPGCSTHIGFN